MRFTSKLINLLCIFLFYLSGCIQETSTSLHYDSGETYILQSQGQISFPLDSTTSSELYFMDLVIIDGKEYLGVVNRYVNAIQLYDLAKEKLYTKITYQREGPEGVGTIYGFKWFNQDSILTVSKSKNQIALVNMEGKFLSKPQFERDRKEGINLICSTTSKGLDYNNTLFFKKGRRNWYISTMNNFYALNPQQLELQYDLVEQNYKLLYVDYPTVYKKARGIIFNGGGYYRDMDKQHNLVYSFTLDHHIWLMNADSNHLHQSILAKSKYLDEEIIEIYKGDLFDENERHRAILEGVGYGSIIYDHFRDVFYRFVKFSTEPTDPVTNRKRDEYHKPFSIMILNSDYKVIGETYFEGEKYNYEFGYFIAKDGLYLSNCNPHNKEWNEDELSFTRFELVKEVL